MKAADQNPALTTTREREIVSLAEALAARVPKAPIDLEGIAASEKIRFCFASFPQKFDGLLTHDGGEFVLICNERRHARNSPRGRFTIAHELGHYFIPSHRAALMAGGVAARIPERGPWAGRVIEQESDLFAASLLMPAPLFRRIARSASGTTLERIRYLAESFGTSITSTAYRALELDLLPAPSAVLLWDPLGAPVGRRLSWKTADLGSEYFTLATKPPPDSVTARVVSSLSWGLHQGESHIMDWFTELDGYDPNHQIQVTEEVMSLGDFGWMTVISSTTL